MKTLIVSIHDVHPGSLDAAIGQVEFCESLGIRRFSILVVPDFHMRFPIEASPDLAAWLCHRERLGDEIVLHGLYHYNAEAAASPRGWFLNRVYTSREAEFLNLDFETARSRIHDGRRRLEEIGLHPVGFIAPAWLMNQNVLRAIFGAGMFYTNTVNSIVAASGRRIPCRSLCYSSRSAWRRAGSLAWNSALWRAKRNHRVVRLSLHPQDLTVKAFRSHIAALISSAAARGFDPTTYSDFVTKQTRQDV
jgi:predicted deacetylase